MTISVVVFIFGALLLLLALLGGGFEVERLRFPPIGRATRSISGVTGLVFVALSIALGTGELFPSAQPPTPRTTSPRPTSVATATEAFPTQRESDLLLHVPKNFRATCTRDDDLRGAAAGLSCSPPTGATTIWYDVYDTTDRMYQEYFEEVANQNISRSQGDCKKDQVAEEQYNISGVTAGHLACYTSGQQSYMIWTYDKLAILITAFRNDLGDQTLYNWWADGTASFVDPGQP